MIAIDRDSYEKFGCVKCGCASCSIKSVQDFTTHAICDECKTEFLIMDKFKHISSIGFSRDSYDGLVIDFEELYNIMGSMAYNKESYKNAGIGAMLLDGFAINTFLNNANYQELYALLSKGQNGIALGSVYVYPIVQEHPRKGTLKHEYKVEPDIMPKYGNGDYCLALSYKPNKTLFCSVESIEAGQRIADMINQINEEYEGKGFSCELVYRENKFDNVHINIHCPDELKSAFLRILVLKNDSIITKEIVRMAINMEEDFANYWKYITVDIFYLSLDVRVIQNIINHFTKRNIKCLELHNYLDYFEVWGVYRQINFEIEKGNIENAIALAIHLVNLYGDYFNQELMHQLKGTKDFSYIIDMRKKLHDELVKAINTHYLNTDNLQEPKVENNFCDNEPPILDFKLSNEMEEKFILDWLRIVPIIFSIVDVDLLNEVVSCKPDPFKEIIQENEGLDKYSNLYVMFSLYGLYVQVSKNIEEGKIKNAVLAVKHVANQTSSPLFNRFKSMTKNNDANFLKIQNAYAEIVNLSSRYYDEQIVPGEPNKFTR